MNKNNDNWNQKQNTPRHIADLVNGAPLPVVDGIIEFDPHKHAHKHKIHITELCYIWKL